MGMSHAQIEPEIIPEAEAEDIFKDAIEEQEAVFNLVWHLNMKRLMPEQRFQIVHSKTVLTKSFGLVHIFNVVFIILIIIFCKVKNYLVIVIKI